MSKKYLIMLKPVGRFFFGGEISFAVDAGDKRQTSYIVHSEKFPQQTSLLGMMRYFLLTQTSVEDKIFVDNKIEDKKKAEKLIGSKSFTIGEKEPDFGEILALSECFLCMEKNGESPIQLTPAPMDFHLDISFQDSENKCFLPGAVHAGKLPVVIQNGKNYKAKDGLEKLYVAENQEIKECEIFVEDSRIGIKRDTGTGRTDESGFYKQIAYRFADQLDGESVAYSFAFEVVLKTEKIEKNKEYLVSLGGDNSMFILKAVRLEELGENWEINPTPVNNLPNKYVQKEKQYTKIVLCSDTYMKQLIEVSDKKQVENSDLFNISEIIPFKALQTTVNTVYYNSFKEGKSAPGKTCRLNLYKRGSVFYFENEESCSELEGRISSQVEFVQIGYNKYVKI